jgi:hypothetical protein
MPLPARQDAQHFADLAHVPVRTSRATWMIEAGANPKDVQGQMRHSRIQTTLDIYAQFGPDSQRRAIEKTSAMIQERITASRSDMRKSLKSMVARDGVEPPTPAFSEPWF